MAPRPVVAPACVDVVHRLPGRIRFALTGLRLQESRAAPVAQFLAEIPGVLRVAVNATTGRVLVEFDPKRLADGRLQDELSRWWEGTLPRVTVGPPTAVTTPVGPAPRPAARTCGCLAGRCRCGAPLTVAPGHAAREAFQPRDLPLSRQLALVVIAGIVTAAMAIKVLLFGRSRRARSAGIFNLAAMTTVLTGYPIFRAGLEGLTVEKKLNNDLLITVASLVAVFLKESVTGFIVVFLVNLSNLFQTLTLDRSRRAIRDMLAGGQRKVWVLVDGVELEIDVGEVRAGDTVVVRAGEKIMVDGPVLSGEAYVNQAPITGESMPVPKQPGDPVYAGTLVEMGFLHIRAEKVGDETAVGRIIHLVEEAGTVKAPIQTQAERFADRFVPFSLAAAFLYYLFTRDFQKTMTILIIACPCAAGLSTPTAVSAALGNAARRGVLIKGGNHLQAMGHVDTVLFDKTGTVTEGKPEVTVVVGLDWRFRPSLVLSLAAGAEKRANHPFARAILQAAADLDLFVPEAEAFEYVIGQGVRARMDDRPLLVGSRRLLLTDGVGTAPAEAKVSALEEHGQTVLLVAFDGELIGLLAVADRLRPESPAAVAALEEAGISMVGLLTGDNERVGRSVARELGMDHVWANLLPEQKNDVVRHLQNEGRRVVMVGEGINDSPALAAADVGIALGTGGTDVAIEAADIVLAGDDPRKVAGVIHLSRQTLAVIHQNFRFAIGINGIGLLLGLAGVISPLTGAMLHNLATLGVVVNSTRLLYHKAWDERTTGAPPTTGRRLPLLIQAPAPSAP